MRTMFTIITTACLFAGCGGGGANAPGSSATNGALATLPLERGFYVTSDTACSEASNATLLLMRGNGMNGSREACDFTSLEQAGPTSYRAAAVCTQTQGRSAGSQLWVFEIPDRTRFRYGNVGSSHQRYYSYCAQPSLPEPWRDNDISGLLGD